MSWRVAGRLAVCGLWMLLAQAAVAVERLPVSAFAQLPSLQGIQLSPDGKMIAGLMNVDNNTYLVTRPLTGDKLVTVYTTDNRQTRIGWFGWANDERLIVSLRFSKQHKDNALLEVRLISVLETRLISVRYDGSDAFNLFGRNLAKTVGWVSQIQDRVVDWMPDDPDHILVEADLDRPGIIELYKVDVNTGKFSKIWAPIHADVRRWVVDRQHRVRVAVKKLNTRYEVSFCDPAQKRWQVGWSFDGESDQEVIPIGFGNDPNILYVSAYHEGHRAIFTADLGDPQHPLRLKHADAQYDVDSELIYSQRTGDYVGVVNANGQNAYEFWHPEYREFAVAIDKAFPNTFNRLVDFSADESLYVLFASGNGRPGIYYVGSQRTGKAYSVGATYPQLPLENLVGKRVVRYKARDGMEIRGYLTLPKEVSPQKLPTVIFPHGGPVSSDDTDFDYWTEFFANRGYAVLQMDFRGSAGYGFEFMRAGLRDGERILNDIADGTRWLIDGGIADRGRICIVGGSFGGYAALMGAARDGELYRCAVSFAGVSDIESLWSEQLKFVRVKAVRERITALLNDHALLFAGSPRLLVDRIGVPILLVHGTDDRSVPFRQSEIMADALKDAGKPFEFIRQEGGDHHLSNYSYRLQMFEAMDRFLAQNLAAPVAAAAEAAEPAATN